MSVDLKTPRGVYHLRLAAPAEIADTSLILPLALERTDGIERVVFRCRIEGGAANGTVTPGAANALIDRIAPAIQRDFETVREAALKSIRGERKLLEIVLSAS
jgi:hypothetical protein